MDSCPKCGDECSIILTSARSTKKTYCENCQHFLTKKNEKSHDFRITYITKKLQNLSWKIEYSKEFEIIKTDLMKAGYKLNEIDFRVIKRHTRITSIINIKRIHDYIHKVDTLSRDDFDMILLIMKGFLIFFFSSRNEIKYEKKSLNYYQILSYLFEYFGFNYQLQRLKNDLQLKQTVENYVNLLMYPPQKSVF